jgi:hypothetical protein
VQFQHGPIEDLPPSYSCLHSQISQNRRIYQPRTKREENVDCNCPIVATGPLRNERTYLQHVSLETNDWHEAEERKARWERWQALSDPKPQGADVDNPTVEQVVTKFFSYHGPALKDWEESSLGKYRVLLLKRLLPFCEFRRIRFMREFDRPSLVNDFVNSWVNLNPTHNKKTSGKVSSVPLKPLVCLVNHVHKMGRFHTRGFDVFLQRRPHTGCGL